MSQLAKTGVRIGPWRWDNSPDHTVSHWGDLELSDANDDDAEATQLQVCDDFISRINIIEPKKRLGEVRTIHLNITNLFFFNREL